MVNEKRIKAKIPELLSPGSLTLRDNFYTYCKTRRKLRKMERKNQNVFAYYYRRIVETLNALEKALEECDIQIE